MKLGVEFGCGVQNGRTPIGRNGSYAVDVDMAMSQWAAQNMGGVGAAALQAYSEIEAICMAAAAFMQRKLSLHGPPVSRGGESGPSPGSFYQPVLHRDLGELKSAVTIRIEGRENVRRRLRDMQNWQGRSGGHIRAVITIGIDSGSPASAYAMAHERGYAPRNLPARPYLAPTTDFIATETAQVENRLRSNAFYETFSGSFTDLPRGFVITRGA